MPTSTATSIVFYDIAMLPPVEKNCCGCNPWKTRQALNFKNLPYTTTWVPLPDIPKARQSLKVPPCRRFNDGSDYHTLPIINDPATSSVVGDSFDIAVYLQNTYPDAGAGNLFPAQKLDYVFGSGQTSLVPPVSDTSEENYPEYARFNINVDTLFTAHVQLVIEHLPLDPETADITKAEFVRRAGVKSWDDFTLVGEQREQMKESFCDALGELAKLFKRDASGPFLLGSIASYADFIVGGWLHLMQMTLPEYEWKELTSWHDGTFGQLYDALEVFAEVK